MERKRWRELRSVTIGELEEKYGSREEPSEADRFEPRRHLHKDDSIFLSRRAQLLTVDQFALQRDLDMLKEMPSTGLRMALQSYNARGAMVIEEFYERYDFLLKAHDRLVGELAEEKKAREEAEKRFSTLEVEKTSAEVKWRKELEAKQRTIADLQVHHSKQQATINKLKGRVAELGESIEGSKQELAEKENQISRTEKELTSERRERVKAQEAAQSDRAALVGLEIELEETKSARDKALAGVNSLGVRLNHLESVEGKKEIINEYRHGPLGRMEMSLAVKAGYDYLKAQLSLEVLDSLEPSYPPRVQSCLSILEDIETQGGRVPLDAGDDDDDDDDDEE